MDQQFLGKVIALTGAASGIGLATAKLLAGRGAKLSLADISSEGLDKVRADIKTTSKSEVITVQTDVSKAEDIDTWIQGTVKHFGRLDGAANIAGVIPKSIGLNTVAEQDLEEWDFLFSVNVRGLMQCMKAELQVLENGGSIVNACSIAGLMGRYKNAAYSSAKHAVLGLTRSAAKEFGHRGIRINCFCPGRIATPMVAAAEKVTIIVNPCALGRDGEAEEVAKAVAFLLSNESS
ncbi:uncharacterized protein LTR77_000234 [Saxophila tyrrhenica]|uniref:Uncharacterized protein n=1 Tax=Saxophila tyrrhenica TaxID=1690608 RepID=A0AAV9PMN4_9PEZI|nr:hypothetical protein LTR77_000234 [Saxophila tyrrhenica]